MTLKTALTELPNVLIDLIERKYVSTAIKSAPMDLGEKINFFSLHTIGEVAYSKPFGALGKDQDIHDLFTTNHQ
jgi:hypothetical protein